MPASDVALEHQNHDAVLPSRVVVLGARGFIGGAILDRLAPDIPTLALGRSSLNLLAPNAGDQLAQTLKSDDVLVFASALAPCRNSQMLRENIVMAESVCAALKQQSVAHVIYISSDAVYKDSSQPLSEASCAEPGSLHGVMHLAREIALRQEFSGPLTVVRPTLVYGIKDPHNGYGPNRFRRLAAEGKEIVLFGKGEEQRDHVDVEDIGELIRLIVLHRSVGIVNAVSGNVVSFRELAEFAVSEFIPHVAIKNGPRNGPMPHNGYRPFDNEAVQRAFPKFRFKSWRVGLSQVHEHFKMEAQK